MIDIQRFQTCHDCLWKVLKPHLTERSGLPDTPNSPKPVFRLAFENDLLAAPVERWLRYADARTGTSHDYDGEKAKACLALMPEFIGDAVRLCRTLTGATWEQIRRSTSPSRSARPCWLCSNGTCPALPPGPTARA